MNNLPIIIVTPVYNDWNSLNYLLHELDRVAGKLSQPLRVLVVDDGSTQTPEQNLTLNLSANILSIDVIQLIRNIGHQRAICIGLVETKSYAPYDAVVVMDADGEDTPESIDQLIEVHRKQQESIVVAARGRRYESLTFKAFHRLYKLLFRALVGKNISFGNYCLIPSSLVERLTYDPNLWNHLAATIVHAGLPLQYVHINRGARYDGQSKMNYQSLIMHGLSAISVFVDILFLRLLILSSILIAISIVGIFIVIGILLFTKLAIPGWSTNAVGILSIILLQVIIFSSGAIFFILNQRAANVFIPSLDTGRLIKERKALKVHDQV